MKGNSSRTISADIARNTIPQKMKSMSDNSEAIKEMERDI
jgi:hypothetical protein